MFIDHSYIIVVYSALDAMHVEGSNEQGHAHTQNSYYSQRLIQYNGSVCDGIFHEQLANS